MRLLSVLFGYRIGGSIYALPVLVSGLVLVVSMPAASRLSELVAQPWSPFPLPFFLAYAITSSVVAIRVGARSTPDDIEPCLSHALLRTISRISFGHFLMLPLIAYSRILFERGDVPIFSMTILIYLVCVMLALLALLMEMHDTRRLQAFMSRRYTSGLRHWLLFAYFSLPLLGLISKAALVQSVALLSPIGALLHLSNSHGWSLHWIVIFAPPVCVLTLSLIILSRVSQRRIHV